MYKIVLCALLVISATLFGNSFAQRLSNRRKFFSSVIEALNKMKSLVSFSGFDIFTVVDESFCNTDIGALFSFEKEAIYDFTDCWKAAVDSIDKGCGLNREDKKLLIRFGQGLGITDIEGQLAHLDLYSELFSQSFNGARQEEKEKGRLYRTLGFSLGCVVTLAVV